MNSQELTIEKFHACTGVQRHILFGWYNNELQEEHFQIDIKKVNEFIEMQDLKEYSKLILNFLNMKSNQIKQLENSIEFVKNNNIQLNEPQNMKSELIRILEFFLSKRKLTSVLFKSHKGSCLVENEKLISILVKVLTDEFIKRGYDLVPLTITEVEKIYQEKTDVEWFDGWKEVWEFNDEKGNPVDDSKFDVNKQYYSVGYNEIYDFKSVYEEMFHAYAVTHPKKQNVDLSLIQQLKKELRKKESGRKKENPIVTQIAFALADLIRIDKFVKDPDLRDIDVISVGNPELRFIYDLMVSFGILEDRSDKFTKEYKSHNYIKSILNNQLKSKIFDWQMYLRKERLLSLKSNSHIF